MNITQKIDATITAANAKLRSSLYRTEKQQRAAALREFNEGMRGHRSGNLSERDKAHTYVIGGMYTRAISDCLTVDEIAELLQTIRVVNKMYTADEPEADFHEPADTYFNLFK